MSVRIHPTALIEEGVQLGNGTSVWDNVHIRRNARIGEECIIGEKSYIAYDVQIGHRVKINAFVYICAEVSIEDGVMISAGTIFTNDRFPRATTADLTQLRSSEPDDQTLSTWVRCGATIGAGCMIGCNLEIGQFAMVGMGTVVTKSVPAFGLVLGHPARLVGFVCRCGHVLTHCPGGEIPDLPHMVCKSCSLEYSLLNGQVHELTPPSELPRMNPSALVSESLST